MLIKAYTIKSVYCEIHTLFGQDREKLMKCTAATGSSDNIYSTEVKGKRDNDQYY
jgi:hypothetical protein